MLAVPVAASAQAPPPAPAKTPPTSSAAAMPSPAQPLESQPATYNVLITIGAQSMKMDIANTVVEQADGWLVTETSKAPQGEALDNTVLDKKTLEVRSRDAKQGPLTLTLKFADGKATGTMSVSGQDRAVAADLGGALFADGPAAGRSIAALPLKAGYTTQFRNFDLQRQKATLRVLTVTGVEDVTVPAGAFKAWKVQIKSAEGDPGEQTLWVDTSTRRVVKTSTTLPQLGGAVATAELAKH